MDIVKTPCWSWGGDTNQGGYGWFVYKGKSTMAHRFIYEEMVGPVPLGLTLDHLCNEPICVNPEHLEPVTMRVNILRGNNPPAINARKTHCPSGHPYSGDNLYMLGNYRYCRQCIRRNNRIYKAKLKAART